MTPPAFVPGLELSAALFQEVEPILRRHLPDLQYAAARLARGSDVLGFDDARSTDHYWGPLLELFVSEEDSARFGERIYEVLADELPFQIRGYPTNFRPFDPTEPHTRRLGHIGVLGHMEQRAERPIHHGVTVMTVRRFFSAWLQLDPLSDFELWRWLVASEQNLRMVTSGRVFRDDIGELSRARDVLRYYPHDAWLYLLAAQWARIGQEEAFVGRTAEAGDALGSRLVAARIVRDLMRLGFLLERTYVPYMKWFGTAFKQLACAAELGPYLERALGASDWRDCEEQLVLAYALVARLHNALRVTEPVDVDISAFHGRPYRVLHAERFAEACERAIISDVVRAWPARVGSVNQFADATDVLDRPTLLPRFGAVYR